MKMLFSLCFLFSFNVIFAQQIEHFGAGIPTQVLASPPDSIVNFPDTEAEYPGGPDSLADFIFLNFILPNDTMNIEFNDDRVYLSFIVEKDGALTNIVVEKGVNEIYDSICMSIVKSMPHWIPARKNGVPVRSLMRLPISIDDAILGSDNEELTEDWIGEEEEEEDRKFGNGHWAGFDIFMSQFMNENQETNFDSNPYWETNEIKSIGLNYNLFDLKFPLVGKHLGITTGLGCGYQNYSFRNNYVLQHTADTIFAVSDTVFDFKSNKLQIGTVSIPLLLDYSSNEKFEKSYFMAVGVVGSYNFGVKQRLSGTYANGDSFDHSTISPFNMNRWTLDATARIGYGHFGMFVSYQLNTMFKTGHTVAMYPFRIGFNILFGI